MPAKSPFRRVLQSQPVRIIQLVIGAILMVLGPLIGGPLPGPLGFLFFGLGLALVLRNSLWARRRYTVLKRRYPKAGSWSDWALRRRTRSGKAQQQPDNRPDPR